MKKLTKANFNKFLQAKNKFFKQIKNATGFVKDIVTIVKKLTKVFVKKIITKLNTLVKLANVHMEASEELEVPEGLEDKEPTSIIKTLLKPAAIVFNWIKKAFIGFHKIVEKNIAKSVRKRKKVTDKSMYILSLIISWLTMFEVMMIAIGAVVTVSIEDKKVDKKAAKIFAFVYFLVMGFQSSYLLYILKHIKRSGMTAKEYMWVLRITHFLSSFTPVTIELYFAKTAQNEFNFYTTMPPYDTKFIKTYLSFKTLATEVGLQFDNPLISIIGSGLLYSFSSYTFLKNFATRMGMLPGTEPYEAAKKRKAKRDEERKAQAEARAKAWAGRWSKP